MEHCHPKGPQQEILVGVITQWRQESKLQMGAFWWLGKDFRVSLKEELYPEPEQSGNIPNPAEAEAEIVITGRQGSYYVKSHKRLTLLEAQLWCSQ